MIHHMIELAVTGLQYETIVSDDTDVFVLPIHHYMRLGMDHL